MRHSDPIAAWDALYWLETADEFLGGHGLGSIAKAACLPEGRTLVVLAELEAGGRIRCECFGGERHWFSVPPTIPAWEGK